MTSDERSLTEGPDETDETFSELALAKRATNLRGVLKESRYLQEGVQISKNQLELKNMQNREK